MSVARAVRAGVPAIRSVRHMGSVPQVRGNGWVIVGQDGGQSIPLDGEMLFVFSDTLLNSLPERARDGAGERERAPARLADFFGGPGVFLANSAALAQTGSLLAACEALRPYCGSDGLPRQILSPEPREQLQRLRFWPVHGALVGDRVYLYYLGVRTVDPETPWGFRTVGTGLSVLEPRTGQCDRVWFDDDWRLFPSVGEDSHFGVQVLRHDGYLYVFGSERTWVVNRARLARVPVTDVARREAYEVLTSTAPSWAPLSPLPSCVQPCDLGACASDYSVSFNEHLGRYLMVYVDAFDRGLVLRTSEHPWGPYTEPYRVTAVPRQAESELVYLGFEHPAYSEDGGRTIYVSYCQPHFSRNALLTIRFD